MEKEISNKDYKELRTNLKFFQEDTPSYVVLIVTHRERERNDIARLNCRSILPVDGYSTNLKFIPIGGYVYDATTDCYLVNCIDHLVLGLIPFRFKAKMEGIGSWTLPVPLPQSLLNRHLNVTQKSDCEKFRASYADPDQFDHHFLQFLSSN
jgi:hypothetical protein